MRRLFGGWWNPVMHCAHSCQIHGRLAEAYSSLETAEYGRYTASFISGRYHDQPWMCQLR